MAQRLKLVPAASAGDLNVEVSRRLEALDAYGILDTPAEAAFDDVAGLAAAICQVPMSAISFVCADRQWFKATIGIDGSETPVEQSFCAHAIAAGSDLFEVRDARRDPRFAGNPLVADPSGIRYYAGMPLVSREGIGMGALCVIDTAPRTEGLTDLQRQTLRTLASQVTAQLELRRAVAERDAHAEQQRCTADELRWLATHDPLTGLGNRALFNLRLQEALSASNHDRRTTMMILDLDHFKQINDTLGHQAGDRLLQVVAERLRTAVRSTDTVTRLGGDEFGLILGGIDSDADVGRITTSIIERLRQPIPDRHKSIEARVTIGAAIFPDHAVNAADLIRHADIALYAAKAAGRGRAAIFDPSMLIATQRHAAMLDHARTALEQDAIVPFYQPKIDLASGAIIGFEALLRVRQADGGFEAPATIAAAFEDGELATRLGTAMIRQAAADMRGWLDAGLECGRIALNASASEFRDMDYADRLLGALVVAGVPADRFEVEVTETVLLDRDVVPVERALTRLSAAGVHIALDDFGTGYASLSHLERFPVDVLKIDQSFVRNIEETAGSGVIISAILSMAANLGIETVAEGIETAAQADYLREKGCRIGQGYLFGRAMPAAAAAALMAGDAVPRARAA